MSRSYKKHLYCGERQNKEDKKIANRKFRRNKNYDEEESFNYVGKNYRKTSESYEIRDYGWLADDFETYCRKRWERWENWVNQFGYSKPRPTRAELKKDYDKDFKRK